jgi:eukaryotic-like serine/threonine-protein kinase
MNYEIGSRVGDYEILEVLGSGGMGRVYKVRNVISDRVEAMKVLLPDLEGNPSLADRFMREIKVQASLDHPNIAALHTALRLDNQLMMLMEYVEGTTLDALMEAGPVPIDKAADYVAQVLSALSYAHARGVVHRDLKPANMMVTAGGLVKLMDFGIAKMTADRKLTQTGSTVGSLYYMSPEQIKGAVDLDPRSDLYSLGVSLYEIVTGARPFQGDSEYSIMAAHLQGNPPPPIQVSPNLPAGLNEIILQALEKDPAKRFQTADAFRNALLYVSKQGQGASSIPAVPAAKKAEPVPIPKPPVPPAAPVAKASRSHRGLWIAIGAVIAIAVIAVVAMQIPKFRRTAAESTAAQPPVTTPAMESQAPASMPAANPVVPQGVTNPAATTTETPQIQAALPTQSEPAPAQSGKTSKEPQPGIARPSAAKASQFETTPKSAAVISTPPAAQPYSGQQAVSGSTRPEAIQASQQPISTASAEDPKKAEQLKEVRDQLDLLSIRMDTVKGSLDTLRKQQASSGLGLRADMASAAQRMELYYSQTETAVKQRDAEAAKKNLDLTEREVSKLENFLHK